MTRREPVEPFPPDPEPLSVGEWINRTFCPICEAQRGDGICRHSGPQYDGVAFFARHRDRTDDRPGDFRPQPGQVPPQTVAWSPGRHAADPRPSWWRSRYECQKHGCWHRSITRAGSFLHTMTGH